MYFKILNKKMNHQGFQYREGLNTDTKPFCPDSLSGCGLSFADGKEIMKFSDCGDKIAIVTVPENEKIVETSDECVKSYRAHAVILSGIRDLWTAETFQWLEENGADIHACNDLVLWIAVAGGHLEAVKYLAENGADIRAYADQVLWLSAANGRLEILKYLAETSVDIHACDDYALELAAESGFLDVVKYLVESGADIHADDDQAALRAAEKNGHYKVACVCGSGALAVGRKRPP